MISILGINYKSAPIEVREKFSIPESDILPFSERLIKKYNFSEIVILSTCNRTEIYYYQNYYKSKESTDILLRELIDFKKAEGVSTDGFYSYHDKDAVEHLFTVTSGIDSMVIGEDQIIGQVKSAYMYCTEVHLTSAILMRLFQKSFEAGKRVRTETSIRKGATSVSQVASDLCYEFFDSVDDKNVMLIGAGETGALTANILTRKGIGSFTVTNRTYSKAEKVASDFGGKAIPFNEFASEISNYDIILVATGSQTPIVTENIIRSNFSHSESNRQLIIDLSVPRNVEQSVGGIKGVKLFAVDDLMEVIQRNQKKRLTCVDSAKVIIDEVVDDYMNWLSTRSLKPAISTIVSNLELVNRIEVESFYKANTPEEKHIISEYGTHLTKKYSRILIKNLKSMADDGKNSGYLEFVNDLFKMS
ncbi:MAG: glutamyl-tRNA reductase [Bacteroidales bacterium]|jgi:glutamyl-tRNA reductase|nr:glutamyl-tRNA reductase [Bacteroidales bacterium]